MKQLKIAMAASAAFMFTAPAALGQLVDFVVSIDQSQAANCAGTGDPGTGSGALTLDLSTNIVTYDIAISGLGSPETVSHVHGAAAPCAGAGDFAYELNGAGAFITTRAIPLPATGYQLRFDYSFIQAFGFPEVDIRTGEPCGATLQQTVALADTGGPCQSTTVNLDAYAGQTVYLRFRAMSSSATFQVDDVVVELAP